MAFTLQTWGRSSVTANEPAITLTSGALVGCNRMFIYTTFDTQATVAASGYFNPIGYEIAPAGDFLYCFSDTDNTGVLYILTNTAGVITTTTFSTVNTVNTGNIADLAVTAAKIANNTITDTQVSVNGLTSLSLNKSLVQFASGNLTTANIEAMYGAPIQLIPAAGANTLIVVKQFTVELAYNNVAFTGGGAFGLQYGNTAALAGPAASNQFSAGIITATASTWGSEANTGIGAAPALLGCANTGIFISNLTAAFATGNSNMNWYIDYAVYTTT